VGFLFLNIKFPVALQGFDVQEGIGFMDVQPIFEDGPDLTYGYVFDKWQYS
jgi:hypothetical protein